MKVCDFKGCHRKHHAGGLCGTHYHAKKSIERGHADERRRQKVHAQRNEENREMTRNKRAAGLKLNISGKATEMDARRLMAMVPPDTRDLTAWFCGDPLPGRSALDRRAQSGDGR